MSDRSTEDAGMKEGRTHPVFERVQRLDARHPECPEAAISVEFEAKKDRLK